MRVAGLLAAVLLAGTATAEEVGRTAVEQCLSCHLTPSGALDIVGLNALEALPEEWPILFEDGFDLDDDGVAGVLRLVRGPERALPATYGRALAAARFEDFALIAGAVHGIELSDEEVMAAVKAAFLARSPDPDPPDAPALARFESHGCAACHVTRTFDHAGRTYMPLSDFLLHDLGEGPRRTAPLWGCPECLDAPAHSVGAP